MPDKLATELTTEAQRAMAAAILELLKRDHVSFAEVQQLEGARGDLGFRIGDNIVLWQGLSEDAATALDHLRKTRQVHFDPASMLVYLVDGAMLRLPIAKRARGYKKPHWLPVVLRPGPDRTARRATSGPPIGHRLRRTKRDNRD